MAGRFTFPDQFSFRRASEVLAEPDEYLKAFVNFKDTETGIVYRGWRLLEGQYGLYMAPPQRKYEFKDKETGEKKTGYEKFVDRDFSLDKDNKRVYDPSATDWWNELTEFVCAEFQKAAPKAAAKKSAEPTKKASARGPAKKATVPDDDIDDLPF